MLEERRLAGTSARHRCAHKAGQATEGEVSAMATAMAASGCSLNACRPQHVGSCRCVPAEMLPSTAGVTVGPLAAQPAGTHHSHTLHLPAEMLPSTASVTIRSSPPPPLPSPPPPLSPASSGRASAKSSSAPAMVLANCFLIPTPSICGQEV